MLMTLQELKTEIKEALEKWQCCKRDSHFMGLEPHYIKKLVELMAEVIVHEEKSQQPVSDGYLLVTDFVKKHPWISYSTLNDVCHKDDEFAKKYMQKRGRSYAVKEQEVVEFFKEPPHRYIRIKNKFDNWRQRQESVQTCLL